MVTTLAALVLGSSLTPGAAAPAWRTDYRQAIVAAQAEHKPVAVFIGPGAGKNVPAEAAALLAKSYVSLTVDTDTPAGKELAGKFGMTEGLVISNSGGDLQALRHGGPVPAAALPGYLAKFSDPARVVTTTEKVGAEAPAVVPASYAAPAYPSAPVFRTIGGCPNGRCPNVR